MARQDPHFKQLVDFFHTGRKRSYKKGEIILHAGDEPRGVYYIEAGLVKIYALSKDSSEHIHLFYGDGDFFPVLWIYREAILTVYYQAMVDTTIWLMPKADFKAFVSSNVRVSELMLEKITGLFRLYAGRIDTLQYSNSYERTATLLVSLAYRFGKEEKAGYVIDAPLTHHDIANSINLSRETVSRSMERLQRKGIINYDKNHHIVITDIPKMVSIVGEDEVTGLWPGLFEQ